MREDIKKDNRVIIGLIVLGVLTFIATLTGTVFSYLTATITGMDATPTAIASANISVSYSDGSKVNMSKIVPGYTYVKKVMVSSTSNTALTYSINWKSITRRSLTALNYKVYKVSSDGSKNINPFEELLVSNLEKDKVEEEERVYSNPSINYTFNEASYESVVDVSCASQTEGSAISSNASSQVLPPLSTEVYYIVFNLPLDSDYNDKAFISELEIILNNVKGIY